MSQVRRQLVVGGCLTALAILVAGPAYADNHVIPVALADVAPVPSPAGSPTSSAPTPSPTTLDDSSLRKAAAYVVAALTDGSHVVGPYGPDLGQSTDVALGLAATADHRAPLAAVVTYLEQSAAKYVHGDPTLGERADANYAGATAKLALLAQVTGNDPTSFGGLDLVSELAALQVTTGPQTGRFADDSAFGDFANPLGQAFGVLALERATTAGAPAPAVDYLVAAQCADGGFPEAFGAKTCLSSPAATGLVLQALVAADADCPATRAQAWLRSQQGGDGSFKALATQAAPAVSANVNSTAYAALGLNATLQSTATALAYLTSTQNPDGGLPPVPSSAKTSELFATAQALVALARSSFLTVGALPLKGRTPTCAIATPTASPTSTKPAPKPSPNTSAQAFAAKANSPTSTVASATPTTALPLAAKAGRAEALAKAATAKTAAAAKVVAEPDSQALRAATEDLPRTGSDLLTPVATGLALVFAGLTLLFASRRRAGRHV